MPIRWKSSLPQLHSATPIGRSDPSVRSFAGNTSPQERHLATHFDSVSVFDIPTDSAEVGMILPPMIFGPSPALVGLGASRPHPTTAASNSSPKARNSATPSSPIAVATVKAVSGEAA